MPIAYSSETLSRSILISVLLLIGLLVYLSAPTAQSITTPAMMTPAKYDIFLSGIQKQRVGEWGVQYPVGPKHPMPGRDGTFVIPSVDAFRFTYWPDRFGGPNINTWRPPALDSVDFTRDTLVAIHAGLGTHANVDIDILGVHQRAGSNNIVVEWARRISGGEVASRVESAFKILVVRVPQASVEFVEKM